MSGESLPSGVLKVAELLPCPFCGVTPVIERCADSHDRLYGERKWWGIKCRSTLNRGGTCAVQIAPQASIEAATERWNRRASPPPQATGALGPLTDAQIEPLFYKAKAMEVVGEKDEFFWFGWGVELAERAHGIGAALQVEPEDKHG